MLTISSFEISLDDDGPGPGYTYSIWYNILLFTDGSNKGTIGNRVPSLFLYGGNWYTAPSLVANMDSKPSVLQSSLYSIQRNKAYDILLTQTRHGDTYVFEMRVEGKTVMSEINKKPVALDRVKVRMTAVTYLPFPGIIYKESMISIK